MVQYKFLPPNTLGRRSTADSPGSLHPCGSGVGHVLTGRKLRGHPAAREETVRKEHLPVFFFFYRTLKIKHFHIKLVICIITLSRWSFTWIELSTEDRKSVV